MTRTQAYQMILLKPQSCLDLQEARGLSKHLTGLVQQKGLWVIDLAQVDFLDNSGLFALVTSLKAALHSGCRLVLCNLQPPVRIIFELTRLDSVFEIHESYAAFLTSLESSRCAPIRNY